MNAKVMKKLGRDFKDDVRFFGEMELEKDRLEEQNARLERFLQHPQNVKSESQESLLDMEFYEKLVKQSYSNSTVVVASDGDNNKMPKRLRNIFTAPSYNTKNKSPNIEVNNNSSAKTAEPIAFPKQQQPQQQTSQQSTSNINDKKTASSRLSLKSASRIDFTDGVFNKKFRTIIEKSIKALNDIKHILEIGIPNPDGAEDYQRRIKRSTEFSARFSRIYLYPLLRQVNDLSIIPSKPNYPGINHKILSPYQTVLQALQAYHGHLPSSIGKCSSDKLKTLLDQAIFLSQMYGVFKKNTLESSDDLNTEFTNAMLTHIELLCETIENFNYKIDSKVCHANEAKKAKLQEQIDKNGTRKQRSLNKSKKKNSEKRFSMYTVTAAFRKDAAWKKAVDSLSKKKMVKSRYKTATYKHRPPVDKPNNVSVKTSCNTVEKRSSGHLKITPINTPIKEDDIETMMEGAMKDVSRPTSAKKRESVMLIHQQEQHQHEEFASRLLQLVRDNDRTTGGASGSDRDGADGGEEANAKKAAEKLGRWLMGNGDGGGVAVLTRLVQEMEAKNKAIAEENRLEFVLRTPAGSEGDVRKARKEPTVTQMIGARNAKLICLRDDNSDQSSTDTLDGEKPKVVLLNSKTLTKLSSKPEERKPPKPDGRKQPPKSNIKISRLPRNTLQTLKCLPKPYVINVIQYKLEFHKHTQQDHMYRKSGNIQPWFLMSQISDEILNDIVHAVSKELEVSEILENLYNAEFQY